MSETTPLPGQDPELEQLSAELDAQPGPGDDDPTPDADGQVGALDLVDEEGSTFEPEEDTDAVEPPD
ncbi:hypothetical protein [Cellulomonas marina]|uniref:Uncharacterized protein n=1 Tax=Cellulomonas marina TaxID=988821 RepID=A0A1I0YCP7_9CELL|nr:hypothetical protein [Cellulomonas marina]GIG29662.1 hypothetical protein Cma02nite_22620 [Cellulomonas marina]SFB10962.1 hypothetical protein SAMN05421867_10755 [Cellulomonas marina]